MIKKSITNRTLNTVKHWITYGFKCTCLIHNNVLYIVDFNDTYIINPDYVWNDEEIQQLTPAAYTDTDTGLLYINSIALKKYLTTEPSNFYHEDISAMIKHLNKYPTIYTRM